jgi:D-3-phosphoglycerate dehydrogenase
MKVWEKGMAMTSTQFKEKSLSVKDDLIWRLDDEFPSHEIERGLLKDRGYRFVVSRNSTFKNDYAKYAPYAKGVSAAVSFRLKAEDIKGLTSCKIICVTGGGYNNVDINAATQQGIIVTYIPGYCSEEVSDHALGMILALNQRFATGQDMTRKGLWKATEIGPFRRLKGQVLGIVGFGRIGLAIAQKARCLGLQIKVFDPYVSKSEMSGPGVESTSFGELMRISDFISLHVLLTRRRIIWWMERLST